MKTGFQVACIAVLLVGCAAPSKYQNDPRAAVVGPDFLDYIDQYPMDRDTQYYYPHLGLADAKTLDTTSAESASSFPQNVRALMIQGPKPAPGAIDVEGQGWPKLEHRGIPF